MVPDQAQFDDRIRNLLALAEDNSAESRTLLFSHICDLFLQNRPMESEKQIRMLVEILNELLGDVELDVRVELRNILLSLDNPPKQLIKLISEDVTDVSGKLLEEAFIDEEQLLYLIRNGSDDHRAYIGKRFGLSPLLRRELDVIRKEQEAKAKIAEFALLADSKKISLQELEEAAQNSRELTEDATASLLETLRTSRHKDTAPLSVVEEGDGEEIEIPEKISLTSRLNLKTHTEETSDIEALEESKPDEDRNEPELEEDSVQYVEEAVSQLIQNETVPQTKPVQDEELILNSASVTDEWFWEIDRNGDIDYLSENAEAIFLMPPTDMIGEDFLNLWIRNDGDIDDHNDIITLFEKRLPFRDEPFSVIVSPNVVQHFLLSGIATFDNDTGRFTGFRGSAQLDEAVLALESKATEKADLDIMEAKSDYSPTFSAAIDDSNVEILETKKSVQKEVENEMLGADDQLASEMLQNLSHEFRTPLNAIIGFSQMIDSEMWGPVAERYKKNTKGILDAANHLKDTVNNILDSAKIDAGLLDVTPESFSLKTALQDSIAAISPILESKDIHVSGVDDNIDVILFNDKQCIMLCLIKMMTYALRKANQGDDFQVSVLVNSKAEVRVEMPLLNQDIFEHDSEKMFRKIKNFSADKEIQASKIPEFETKITAGFGLSVAREVANLIGGEVNTHSENGKIKQIALIISTYPI
ncbi:PAS domain-containing sensor histidine kinase [Pseudemcibacter aquimaris]|uniref:sensor histidine kinase n=1 Tax=Pseudemcibacter aquimaris TaxID=2857064 RepID=UPI0020133ED4|nr:histidine kinase dimerization/phospho-acceptor domain-containing protein [Pseudemcibacter aquimaris]MCC3861447.1 hypothetical protein [Pseudemcibacter aquimaris]WDU58216.1 hypothetical protein KW060_13570 [Pseudemcibacter aquimaris]